VWQSLCVVLFSCCGVVPRLFVPCWSLYCFMPLAYYSIKKKNHRNNFLPYKTPMKLTKTEMLLKVLYLLDRFVTCMNFQKSIE